MSKTGSMAPLKVGRIRDVARATGLSVATISRVMNGATNVRKETRARVLAATEELDYVPNPAARALSTNRSKTIAAIIPTIEHSVFAKYIEAIEKTLGTRGYSLVLAISNGREAEELEEARKLLSMGADAFILSGMAHLDELYGALARRNIPYVFTSVWDPDASSPTIGYNNFRLAQMAAEFLAGKGHRKVAVLHGPLAESDRTIYRKQGAQSVAHLFETMDFYESELSVAGGKTSASRLTRSGVGYSAALCFSDVLALGSYFAFQEIGIKIPNEMSVMGFDNLDWSTQVVPPLTTINLPAAEMGISVANVLMDFLEGGSPISGIELKAQIIERESVAEMY